MEMKYKRKRNRSKNMLKLKRENYERKNMEEKVQLKNKK